MLEPSDRADRYRFRAEELRTICSDWQDANAIETLVRLAMQYEAMADKLDRAKANGKSPIRDQTPPDPLP